MGRRPPWGDDENHPGPASLIRHASVRSKSRSSREWACVQEASPFSTRLLFGSIRDGISRSRWKDQPKLGEPLGPARWYPPFLLPDQRDQGAPNGTDLDALMKRRVDEATARY